MDPISMLLGAGGVAGSMMPTTTTTDIFTMRDFKGGSANLNTGAPLLWIGAGLLAGAAGVVAYNHFFNRKGRRK